MDVRSWFLLGDLRPALLCGLRVILNSGGWDRLPPKDHPRYVGAYALFCKPVDLSSFTRPVQEALRSISGILARAS